jgi:ankyrin repeat protein
LFSDWTDLHRAVWNHDAQEVESLLQGSSAIINSVDEQGWTPLHLACAAETSMLFVNQQIDHRGRNSRKEGVRAYLLQHLGRSPRLKQDPSSSRKQYNAHEWGPKRIREGDSERVASMKVLQILLGHGALGNLVNIRAHGFCTPLHCAANSGWLSHAVALVQAGANVYTGPESSPLCWAKDGSDSMHPVAIYLRIELGDQGLTNVEQDHARKNGTAYKRIFPREEAPLFKKQTNTTISTHGLCSVCSEMTLESLVSKPGFKHLSLFGDVERSARRCKFCLFILSALSRNHSRREGQVLVSAREGSVLPLCYN